MLLLCYDIIIWAFVVKFLANGNWFNFIKRMQSTGIKKDGKVLGKII
jgi:hypothetical protein